MNNRKFDFNQAIDELDKSNVIGSLEQLGDQVQHIWQQAKEVTFDASYREINKVVVAGMGGSVLGTHVIQSVYKDQLKMPVDICSDYTLPNYVDDKTLVVGSSYSGTTEETLSAVKEGLKKGAKITGITTGGKLAPLLQEKGLPFLKFDPQYNPSNQPRMALGYSVFGQISLFAQLGLLDITEDDYQQVLETIAQLQLTLSRHNQTDQNPAKLLAFSMLEHIPVITASEHLVGSAHVIANQLNESAKNYSELRIVPDINHHLMEGLQFPKSNHNSLFFFIILSDLYRADNQKRMKLTQQVVEKNNINSLSHQLTAPTKLSQAFELILLGGYAVFYLAILNHQNPAPIPWVDWFKAELKK